MKTYPVEGPLRHRTIALNMFCLGATVESLRISASCDPCSQSELETKRGRRRSLRSIHMENKAHGEQFIVVAPTRSPPSARTAQSNRDERILLNGLFSFKKRPEVIKRFTRRGSDAQRPEEKRKRTSVRREGGRRTACGTAAGNNSSAERRRRRKRRDETKKNKNKN